MAIISQIWQKKRGATEEVLHKFCEVPEEAYRAVSREGKPQSEASPHPFDPLVCPSLYSCQAGDGARTCRTCCSPTPSAAGMEDDAEEGRQSKNPNIFSFFTLITHLGAFTCSHTPGQGRDPWPWGLPGAGSHFHADGKLNPLQRVFKWALFLQKQNV